MRDQRCVALLLDPLAGLDEHGPVARIEDLDPLRLAGELDLQAYCAHVAIVNQSDRARTIRTVIVFTDDASA